MERLFGGNPIGVILRLVILSVVVGIIMAALDIRPDNIFYHLQILARRIYDLGFGIFEWMFQYLLLGAVIVVPIWLIMRVVSGLRGDSGKQK
jgi:hypothetical protein